MTTWPIHIAEQQGATDGERSAAAIIKRIKELASVKTDADLARMLGTQRVYLAQWRKRNSIPFGLIIAHASIKDWDLTYIFTGHPDSGFNKPLEPLDLLTLKTALNVLADRNVIDILDKNKNEPNKIDNTATLLAKVYNFIVRLSEDVSRKTKLPVSAAKNWAVLAAMQAYCADEDPDFAKVSADLCSSLSEPTEEGPQ